MYARSTGGVQMAHITSFFVKYIQNVNLGQVANAHLVHADLSDLGARDEKCIRLAELHYIAVDYPKTGKPAQMGPDLRPKRYPDFMQNKRAPETYESQKVRVKQKVKVRFSWIPDISLISRFLAMT